jgi:hypothetical protein
VEAYVAPGGWVLEDFTQDTEISGNWDYSIQGADSAEAIAEAFGFGGTQVTLANFTEVAFAVSAESGVSFTHFCSYNLSNDDYEPANSNTYYIDMKPDGVHQNTTETCTGTDEFQINTEGTGY